MATSFKYDTGSKRGGRFQKKKTTSDACSIHPLCSICSFLLSVSLLSAYYFEKPERNPANKHLASATTSQTARVCVKGTEQMGVIYAKSIVEQVTSVCDSLPTHSLEPENPLSHPYTVKGKASPLSPSPLPSFLSTMIFFLYLRKEHIEIPSTPIYREETRSC